jgi:hypothetical protein
MAEYVDETIDRIKSSVKGILIVSYSGAIIKSTFELNKKESSHPYMQTTTMLSTSLFSPKKRAA